MANLKLTDSEASRIVDVWKTIVGVQMHFNEISMRVRGLFITLLLGLYASIGFVLDNDLAVRFVAIKISYATILPLIGICGALLFYLIDRYWYHRLLRGSVLHAIDIETKYRDVLPELSLSEYIGKESYFVPKGIYKRLASIVVRHDKFVEKGELHSDGKLEIFYKSVMWVLFITSVILAIFGGLTFGESDQSKKIISTSSAVSSTGSKADAPALQQNNLPSPPASPATPTPPQDPASSSPAAPSPAAPPKAQ